MQSDILNGEADSETIHRLHQKGILTSEARGVAMRLMIPSPSAWRLWADRALLFLGAALVLSGILFFFAYNWADMGKFMKLGLAEGAVVLCLVASWKRGIETLSGKVLLMGASVLTGVFLAVLGQTYQTGADVCRLFAGWAFLISGWVLCGDFASLWFLWLVLLNLAIAQFGSQTFARSHDGGGFLLLLLAAINLSALAGKEFFAARGFAWLSGRWMRICLILAVLLLLVPGPFSLIMGSFWRIGLYPILGTLSYAVLVILGFWYYFRVCPDLGILALQTLSVATLVVLAIGRLLAEVTHDLGYFAIMSLVILGVFGAAASALRWASLAMKESRHV